MDTNYDEDISENQFFRLIINQYKSTVVSVANGGGIICIPRHNSFIFNKIREDDVIHHILIPNDLKPTCTIFHTLNGKTVRLTNGILTLECDANTSSYSSQLLFGETFYTENRYKYRVWYINKYYYKRLISKPQHFKPFVHYTVTQNHYNYFRCVDRPLLQYLYVPWKILNENVSNLTTCIMLLQTEVCQTNLRAVESILQELQKTSKLLENASLEHTKKTLQCLFNDCLDTIMSDVELKTKNTSNPFLLHNIQLSLETYIQHDFREIIWKSLSNFTACEDARLNKILRNSNDLQCEDLGIRQDLHEIAQRSKNQISRFGQCFTMLGKIECLKKSLQPLLEKSSSSDEFLPVVIFLIIKAGLPNWIAQITFMKNFRFFANPVEKMNRDDYLITSLEAGVEYIKSERIQLSIQDEIPIKNYSLEYLHCCVKRDDSRELERLLRTSPEIERCHPLCGCDSCEMKNSRSKRLTVRSRDDKGSTPLHVATLYERINVIEYLLNEGANVDDRNFDGLTPLHLAMIKGNQKLVLLLLHKGADPKMTDKQGNTALHFAADRGHEDCIKALLYVAEQLKISLDVSPINFNRDTPLHYAAKLGYLGILQILIDCGANPTITDKQGQTPLDVAHNSYIANIILGVSPTNRFG